MKGKITITGINVDMTNSPFLQEIKDMNDKVDVLLKEIEWSKRPILTKIKDYFSKKEKK